MKCPILEGRKPPSIVILEVKYLSLMDNLEGKRKIMHMAEQETKQSFNAKMTLNAGLVGLDLEQLSTTRQS